MVCWRGAHCGDARFASSRNCSVSGVYIDEKTHLVNGLHQVHLVDKRQQSMLRHTTDARATVQRTSICRAAPTAHFFTFREPLARRAVVCCRRSAAQKRKCMEQECPRPQRVDARKRAGAVAAKNAIHCSWHALPVGDALGHVGRWMNHPHCSRFRHAKRRSRRRWRFWSVMQVDAAGPTLQQKDDETFY